MGRAAARRPAYRTAFDRFEAKTIAAYTPAFVGGAPIVNRRPAGERLPATTPESDAMSKALRKRGFTCVGSTICYAFMQVTGMVNDHVVGCPARRNRA